MNNSRVSRFQRIFSRTGIALLLCTVLLSAVSCGTQKIKVDRHLSYDANTDTLTDSESGVSYQFASVSYEPAYVGDAYADWSNQLLYEVKGWDPEVLLTEEFTGIGGLLYADSTTLPTVSEMNADTIYVCMGNLSTTCIQIIDDEEMVKSAARLMDEGEVVELPQDGETSFSLKFASSQYAGIYYNVIYVEVGDGDNAVRYLYDRGTKRCVEATGDLFYGYLWGEAEETEQISSGSGTQYFDEDGNLIYSFEKA